MTIEFGPQTARVILSIGEIMNEIGSFEIELVPSSVSDSGDVVARIETPGLTAGLRHLADTIDALALERETLRPAGEAEWGITEWGIQLSDNDGTIIGMRFPSELAALSHIKRSIASMPKHRIDPRWADAQAVQL